MQWLWAYFRRKTMESLLAGVHDALASGDESSSLTDEQAARALRALIGTPDAVAELEGTSSPPILSAPAVNGTAALSDQAKRGPGRPRKFQEPPA
jgi:hypothetical protein